MSFWCVFIYLMNFETRERELLLISPPFCDKESAMEWASRLEIRDIRIMIKIKKSD